MNRTMIGWTFVTIAVLVSTVLGQSTDYPIRPVPAHQVKFADGFWSQRLEINRTVTIPASFRMCDQTGRIENFKVAGGLSDKKWTGRVGFNDSDVSKIIQGGGHPLVSAPPPHAHR